MPTKRTAFVLVFLVALCFAYSASADDRPKRRRAPEPRCGPVELPQYAGSAEAYAGLNRRLRDKADAGWRLVSVSHVSNRVAVACWVR